ncbi:MAG: hypothetical protein NWE92_03415 [Candidatus Bathyarchaeota archaeon]|nr:hypothetical protein [Candidatus Bathyarchaeota archaeon]
MERTSPSFAYKGRSLGVIVLVAAQILIGVIHVASGLWMLTYEFSVGTQTLLTYDIYTIVFGVLTLGFAVLVWQQKRLGLYGTVAVSVFVVVADSLTILNLPSIPGIPKLAGVFEISYSVIIILYLLQAGVREKFR